MFDHRRTSPRRGTTIVETAVVLPVFLLLLLAIFEFGHAQLVNNVLNSACRNAARLGAVEGTTTAQIEQAAVRSLGTVVPAGCVSVFVKDASVFDSAGSPPTNGNGLESLPNIEVADAEPRTLFVVRASVAYNDVAIVPMPFLSGVILDGQSFMRHE